MPDQKRKSEYVLTALLVLVMLAYLAVFTVIDFRGFARLATADMYEDTLVARLIWEGKTLFPKRYLFGNQLYVIATPVLSALFYGLTGSMNRAMAIATACMSLFLLLSMDWMLRASVRRPSLRAAVMLVFLAVFFGPNALSREDGQQLFFSMCSYYSCYLICLFVVLGDYARARSAGGHRLPALLLALFLCFCTGVQSLRQTCVMTLPLLLFEALSACARLRRGEKLFSDGSRPALTRVLLYTAANFAGVLFVGLLPIRRHTIYSGASVFAGAGFGEKFRDLHQALTTVTGYDYTRSGDGRLFFILMFVVLNALVLAALWLLLHAAGARRRLSGAALLLVVTVLGCLAVTAASFVTSVRLRPIYLFLYYILPALSLALIGEYAKPKLLTALMLALCLLSAVNLPFSYGEDLRRALDDAPIPAQQISDWAVSEGYELVYGESSVAPRVAVFSDGKLIAGCWEDVIPFKVTPHINIRDIYSIEDYRRAIFVFVPWEAKEFRSVTDPAGIEMSFHGQYGEYHVYTSSGQLLYPATEVIDLKPEYN